MREKTPFQRIATPVFVLTATIALSLSACGVSSASGSADSSSAAASAVTDGSVTSAVQEAAAAFVATLDADQLALLQYDYDDADAKSVWSNLPVGSAGSTNDTSSDTSSDAGGGQAGAPSGGMPGGGGTPPSGFPTDGSMPSGMPTDMPTGMPDGSGGGFGGTPPSGGAAPGGTDSGTGDTGTGANFSGGGTARNGLSFEDMTEEQQQAALAVIDAFLSDQGMTEVEDIMAADDVLDEDNGGNSGWSSDKYFIAFFGDPADSDTFMIQFGGHHLALNADFQGDEVSIVPEFIGIEPTSYTNDAGETVVTMAQETDSLFAILGSLSSDELAQAKLDLDYSDIVKGAGADATAYPDDQDDGVLVSDLTSEQQDLVTAAIQAWVGDLDASVSDALVAKYVSEYDQTYVSWSISSDSTNDNAYVRISGPSVWIEYSHQPGVGESGWHIHSVYRDKNGDYDAAAVQ